MEIKSNTVLVSAKGGQLDFVRDGEVLASVVVPPGRVPVSDYLDLVPDGAEVQVSGGLVPLTPAPRVGIQRHDMSLESGANPDYQPTSATRLEMQMRVAVNHMAAATSELEARMRALDVIERVPRAPDPVIESIEAPPQISGGKAPKVG